jgi:exodeoxyribonuclease VII large subunit
MLPVIGFTRVRSNPGQNREPPPSAARRTRTPYEPYFLYLYCSKKTAWVEWQLTVRLEKGILCRMSQLSFFQKPAWSVTDLTYYMRQLLENDYQLQDVWVSGEVSNCSRPSSGHLYFTLKDSAAALRCVMWRTNMQRQSYIPRDGDAIEVHGSVGVYEAAGTYQLYADRISPLGEGLLFKEFVLLKERLEAEGLFDPERKRAIPSWPRRIGVVTSPTGAALRDVLNTIRRRCPALEVVLAPTPVQGEEAPAAIVAALQRLEECAQPDLILLVRGGGSIEDLWAFNDEKVARAIAASRAPIISGVGHETDFTIADFIADLRAPTPTAAAELATPDQEDLQGELAEINQRLKRAVRSRLLAPQVRIQELQRRLQFHSPRARLRSGRQRMDEWSRRAETAVAYSLALRQERLLSLQQRVASLNPQAVLARGYAMVMDQDGQLVSRSGQVWVDQHLKVRLSDGEFGVLVHSAPKSSAPKSGTPKSSAAKNGPQEQGDGVRSEGAV